LMAASSTISSWGSGPWGAQLKLEFDRLDQRCEFRQKLIGCF